MKCSLLSCSPAQDSCGPSPAHQQRPVLLIGAGGTGPTSCTHGDKAGVSRSRAGTFWEPEIGRYLPDPGRLLVGFLVWFCILFAFAKSPAAEQRLKGSVLPKRCPGWAEEAPRTVSCPPAAHYRMLLLIQVFNTVIGLVIVERKRHLVALWRKAFPIEKGCNQTYLIQGEGLQSHLQNSNTEKSRWLLFFGSMHAACLPCERLGFRAGITSSPSHMA